MSTPLVTVAPTARYGDVVDVLLAEADLLRREVAGPPPVVLAGRAQQAERLDLVTSDCTSATLMSCPVETASDDDLPTTAHKLLDSGYRRLPVVADDGRLVGVVARRDLLVPAWSYPTRES
jgi:CBS domain-containing protein